MSTRYDRIVSAVMDSQSISAVNNPLLELVISANSYADIIRVEVGPSEGTDPVQEVQEVELRLGTAIGTGGTALTENLLSGFGTIQGVAQRNKTSTGTSTSVYRTAYNCQVGWLYLPVPEERLRLIPGDDDVFMLNFPVAPDAAMTISATLVWGEIG